MPCRWPSRRGDSGALDATGKGGNPRESLKNLRGIGACSQTAAVIAAVAGSPKARVHTFSLGTTPSSRLTYWRRYEQIQT